MKIYLKVIILLTLIASLAGCNNASSGTSAVENMTGVDLLTNYADDGNGDDRNPRNDDAFENYLKLLRNGPIDLDQKVYDKLRNNPHVSNIQTQINSEINRAQKNVKSGSETVNFYVTSFTVDDVYRVRLFTLVPGIRILSFWDMTKSPRRVSVDVSRDGQQFINGYGSAENVKALGVLVGMIYKDENHLSNYLNQEWAPISDLIAKNNAMKKAAERQKLIEAENADFEVDPGASPEEQTKQVEEHKKYINDKYPPITSN